MPIYDYTCSACGHLTEVIHGIYDHGPRFCPECGAEGTMTKGFTTPAIHFKGSGWAKKDRSSSAAKAAAKTPADSAPGSEGGGSTSDEVKPAAKESTKKADATSSSTPAPTSGAAD